MYIEFIGIFIGLGVLFAIQVVMMILLIILLKRSKNNSGYSIDSRLLGGQYQNSEMLRNTAFCRKCATEFNASQRVCPRCGTPRI